MTNKEVLKKSVDITGKIFKPVIQIGNTVLVGAVFGACIAFPPIAIPLKVCAGLSMAAISDLLTIQTNKHVDNCVEDAYKILEPFAEALDKDQEFIKEIYAEANNGEG